MRRFARFKAVAVFAITIPKQVLLRSQYADDRTQTGREIDIYGERLSSQPKMTRN
jgi:hypothetical protein